MNATIVLSLLPQFLTSIVSYKRIQLIAIENFSYLQLNNRLLAEVGKRGRVKGKRNRQTPFPLTFSPFPPLTKGTFARGLMC